MEEMTMTTALIVGGGIAGPVTAMALQRAGIEVVVFEQHPDTGDDIGAFLTLQTNGLDALRAIDAHRAVASHGFPTPTIKLYGGNGKHLGTVRMVGRCRTVRSVRHSSERRFTTPSATKRCAGA
jgi:2-polyprenyl-6-methoxyphenol hydroxylase-like FAD-dependent oxidoreductase